MFKLLTTATESARVKYSKNSREFLNLKIRIRDILLKSKRKRYDNMSPEERKQLADKIALNWARVLFSFLRSIGTIESYRNGKCYDPILFIPDENPFFDYKTTYFRKLCSNKANLSHGIHRAKSELKKIFISEDVKKRIDAAFDKYDSKTEGGKIAIEISAISEVVNVLNLALVFDMISSFGYKIDKIFEQPFLDISYGNHEFVLDRSIFYIGYLSNWIHAQGKLTNK